MLDGAEGVVALLQRAHRIDNQAVCRLQAWDPTSTTVYVTTPFDVIAARRVGHDAGAMDQVEGAVIPVAQVLALDEITPRALGTLGRVAPAWPGALPPASGFALVETIPADVVFRLAEEGRALAAQFSGPLGPPASLLNQIVVDASSAGGNSAQVPMRMVFAATALGLIPGLAAAVEVPRVVRVSRAGRWVRLDAAFGSVFYSAGLPLVVS